MSEAHARTATLRITLISAVAAAGGFLFGFDTAVINGAVGSLRERFAAGDAAIGLAVSSALLGSAVGSLWAGRLADRHGRVRAMWVTAALFIVSGFLSGAAFTLWDFCLWRFGAGVAIGLASVIAPAYISEIAPAHLRGRLTTLQQLAVVIGIFAALLGDYAVAAAAGSANADWMGFPAWRWMLWTELLPAIFYGLGALFIPESPRWLVARGRRADAARVLERIQPGDPSAKLDEIERTVQVDQAPRWSDLRGPRFGLLPIVWVGIALSVFQQLVGINVIFYYSSVLWQSVGFSEKNALAITVITSITNIVTTLVAIATVDRFGRKPLLVVGSAGMLLTLATMAVLFARAPLDAAGHPVLGSSGPIALVAANLYVFCFGFSWGPVVWVLLGEMFNNRIRASALSLAAAAQWVANFGVTATFPSLQRAGLGIAYGLYAAAAFASLFYVRRYVQETRGKELEEM